MTSRKGEREERSRDYKCFEEMGRSLKRGEYRMIDGFILQ